MCGIVGLVGRQPVATDLVAALERLEYRGYDSAGVALTGDAIFLHRTIGRARDLSLGINAAGPTGCAGIGHTRWATHGRPELRNAHPHAFGNVAVVHNGVIENHAALRARLTARGHSFASDTDSVVIPHLLADALMAGAEPREALANTCRQLEGSFAIAALVREAPGRLFVARHGSPLVVAEGAGMRAIASDPTALAGLPLRYAPIEDGEVLELDAEALLTEARDDRHWQAVMAGRSTNGNRAFRTDTRCEIAEQPDSLRATAAALAGRELPAALRRATRLVVVACGSSLLAAGTARAAMEKATGLAVDLEVASEYRDRTVAPVSGTAALLVSQSGETADTIATMERLRAAGCPIVGVVNVPHSAIGRQADAVWPTTAGQELGVAATKTFTAQLMALTILGMRLGEARGTLTPDYGAALRAAIAAAPGVAGAAAAAEPACIGVAARMVRESDALFIGRGAGAFLAAEAALKLKELSYLRAEGIAAGELKRGPIALIREGTPVVAIAPGGAGMPKLLANMNAVRARGAWVVALTDAAGACAEAADEVVILPGETEEAAPFAAAVALQLIAFHAALILGRDVDRPRNVAKSVTVE